MIKVGPKQDEGAEHEPAPHPRKESRSQHHVERVIARIFTRQQAHNKERSSWRTDFGNDDKDWYRH
jgi:phosphopentomutase